MRKEEGGKRKEGSSTASAALHTRLLDRAEDAAALLRAGGLVAFPTETVYGLGADATDAAAVARVFAAKGRPADNPLIVHLPDAHAFASVAVVTEAARALLAFVPGPLTLVLPSRGTLPEAVTAGLDTVAVRVPDLELARDVLRLVGRPVVAPSANRSGRPSPTAWQAALADLDGRIDAVLRGEPTTVGVESTVVDATGAVPVVLRPGGVTLEQIRSVVPQTRMRDEGDGLAERSPGLRHRHYAPAATVRVLDSIADARPGQDALYVGLAAPPAGYAHAVVPVSVEAYTQVVFAVLRDADRRGVSRVDALAVPDDGLGRALMDRLRRAAAR